jgi:hypothetical protein
MLNGGINIIDTGFFYDGCRRDPKEKRPAWGVLRLSPISSSLFVFVAVELFDVDRVLHGFAFVDRRFREILTAAKFFEDAGAFVFSFKFFECAFDVFALFYRHDDHDVVFF